MKVIRTSLTAAVVILMAMGAHAQSMRDVNSPAELPPPGYKDRQFVDSRGCIFVRAGYDGNVNWVPRVTRSRQVLCGYQPTFAAGTAPAAKTSNAPEIKVASAPAVAPPPAVVKPVPKAQRSAPVVIEVPATTRPATTRPAATRPVVIEAAKIAPRPSAARIQKVAGAACAKLGAESSRYIVRVDGFAVRCGPQAESPSSQSRIIKVEPYSTGGYAPSAGQAGGVQVAPLKTPKGYRQVFTDDRLNPNRGPRTAAGDMQMAQVWETDKAPMVAKGTKRNALGKIKKVPNTRIATRSDAKAVTKIGTKSSAGAPVKGVAPAGGYVQVGTYGVPANAKASIARLQAAGMPVVLGRTNRGGKALQIVLAGPFASATQARSALTQLRGAGYTDAFIK